jgi:glycerol-3-phosphate dehydrogenase
MDKQLEADVVIIGGGITGTAIARELSRYQLETVLVEKAGYIGAGQTKASLGTIYCGLPMMQSFVLKSVMSPEAPIYEPDSQKIKWLEEGFEMWPRLFEQLDIQHLPLRTLVVARNEKEISDLEFLRKLGEKIGGTYADLRWADRKTCFEMEPHLIQNAVAGLYSEGQCFRVSPWELALAFSDNAKENGVKFILNAEVTGVSHKNGYQVVSTTQGPVGTRFIVNAAGLFADVVADMGGARDWKLSLARNMMIVLDKRVSGLVRNFLMTPAYPGVVTIWSPTLDGNILLDLGTYDRTDDKEDRCCHRNEYSENIKIARWLIPEISEKDIIRAFVGLRAFNTRDPEENIVEPSSSNPRFINVAVRLPGLISAPPVAKSVVGLLGKAGLELVINANFTPCRRAITRFRDLPAKEQHELISQTPHYGHVICRCETITEGEVVEAIKRGARTVSEVKYRTRAGMGRCQGGFCGPHVVAILARELNVPVTQIKDSTLDSPVVPYESKELLREVAGAGGGDGCTNG